MPLCHFDSYNLWILKPTHLNRGRGIHVFRDLDTCHKLIKQYCQGKELKPTREAEVNDDDEEVVTTKRPSKVKFNTFIIQKYIEKPLLVNKRKFDIRVWVLYT